MVKCSYCNSENEIAYEGELLDQIECTVYVNSERKMNLPLDVAEKVGITFNSKIDIFSNMGFIIIHKHKEY